LEKVVLKQAVMDQVVQSKIIFALNVNFSTLLIFLADCKIQLGYGWS